MKTAIKKIIAPIIVISFIFIQPAHVQAQYSGEIVTKTALQNLVPIAQMRAPLVEAKELDGCIVGLANAAAGAIGGVMNGGGLSGAIGGAVNNIGCSWDSIAWFLAKQMIGVQFNGMKSMAQNGFFGGTSFVDNPQAYYHTVNGEVSDYFMANDYSNANLLNTIKGNARVAVLSEQNTPFTTSISSGIDFPGGDSGYQAFLANGTCQTGNYWDCYDALQSPKNDAFSVQMRTSAALAKQQNEALAHTQAEVQAGKGYRDVKQNCVYGHYVGCTSVTPGSSVGTSMDNYLQSSLNQLQAASSMDNAVAPAVVSLYKTTVGWLGNMNLKSL